MEERTWTAARIGEVRMKELMEHQGRLLRSGLASNIDEVATARRKMMELMGPSGGNFFKTEQDRTRSKC